MYEWKSMERKVQFDHCLAILENLIFCKVDTKFKSGNKHLKMSHWKSIFVDLKSEYWWQPHNDASSVYMVITVTLVDVISKKICFSYFLLCGTFPANM